MACHLFFFGCARVAVNVFVCCKSDVPCARVWFAFVLFRI